MFAVFVFQQQVFKILSQRGGRKQNMGDKRRHPRMSLETPKNVGIRINDSYTSADFTIKYLNFQISAAETE